MLEIPVGHSDGLQGQAQRGAYTFVKFNMPAGRPFTVRCRTQGQSAEDDLEFYLGDCTVPQPSRELHSFACVRRPSTHLGQPPTLSFARCCCGTFEPTLRLLRNPPHRPRLTRL